MPRDIITTVYKYAELDDKAKKKARDWYIGATQEDQYPADEICDSLKALFGACSGIKLTDWSIGGHSHSYVRISFAHEEAGELSGGRACAWLENNLLGDLRLPFRGPKRWEYAKYGESYRPRIIKPCPFTGVCYDDDFLDELRKDVASGSTLRDAFKGLADRARRIIEAEYESRQTVEYIEEMIEVNEYEFTKEGKRVRKTAKWSGTWSA